MLRRPAASGSGRVVVSSSRLKTTKSDKHETAIKPVQTRALIIQIVEKNTEIFYTFTSILCFISIVSFRLVASYFVSPARYFYFLLESFRDNLKYILAGQLSDDYSQDMRPGLFMGMYCVKILPLDTKKYSRSIEKCRKI